MFNHVAHFRCCGELTLGSSTGCKKEFRMPPGPRVACPYCGSIYAKWLDYSRFEKARLQDLAAKKV